MSQTSLLNKAPDFQFVLEAFERYGYALDKRDNRINLLALRNRSARFNRFDDFVGVLWFVDEVPYYKVFPGTTRPGRYYLVDTLLNPRGCAVLEEGQYVDSYKLGKHKGKDAFVQAKPVVFRRDGDRDLCIDPHGPVEKGFIGLNIHSTSGIFPFINKWSAGCIVYQNPRDLEYVLELAKFAYMVRAQDTFSLTLISYG